MKDEIPCLLLSCRVGNLLPTICLRLRGQGLPTLLGFIPPALWDWLAKNAPHKSRTHIE
ncbi:MAG: hypothetical protein WC009_04180 [Methylotenera sp.]